MSFDEITLGKMAKIKLRNLGCRFILIKTTFKAQMNGLRARIVHLLGAPSGGRTHTWRILSPLPLPLGYRGARNKGAL